jgi:hypothetical protein
MMATHLDAEKRVEMGFWIHLAAYVLVVGALAILNFNRNPDNLWVLWVAGGWGIGIVAHAAAFLSPQLRERMVERTTERMGRRESRTDETHMTERMSQSGR